jgi:long-chain acyl-CoA synthetase
VLLNVELINTCRARGANIFSGYFKDEKNTEETLHDGWIATGDVGRWNPNGFE